MFQDDGHSELQTRMYGSEWRTPLASKYVAEAVNHNVELDRFLRVEFAVFTRQTVSAFKEGVL